jgi:O-antigen ligase
LFAQLSVTLLYGGGFLTVVMTVFKRAELGLFVLVALTPLPNLRYKLHGLPLGKDLIDILIAAIVIGIFINKKGFETTKNSLYLMLFIVLNYVAVWNVSINFDLTAPISPTNAAFVDWKNYAEMIFLYFLAANAVRDEKQQQTLLVVMAAVILFIGFREFRNFSEGAAFSYDKRAEGPFWVLGLGANHLGAFIAHYCGLLFGLFLLDDNRNRRWLYLLAILLGLHPLFFSYSRGAYMGAVAVLAFYGLIRKRSLLIVLGVAVISWQTLLPHTVVERIEMTKTSEGQIEGSAAQRIDLWNHAIDLFHENPVFGVGYGGFGLTVPEGSLTDTHNIYVKMLAEQGIIGFILFLFLLMKAFHSGWRLYRLNSSPFHTGLGLGFMGCIVAAIVTNMFGDRWSYFAMGGYFFVFWGLIDRAILILNERPKTLPTQELL